MLVEQLKSADVVPLVLVEQACISRIISMTFVLIVHVSEDCVERFPRVWYRELGVVKPDPTRLETPQQNKNVT
eukprot:6410962-Amphidinium_carterae.1